MSDPLAMCEQLSVTLSEHQRELVIHLARARGRVDLGDDEHGDNRRAILLTTFWRTLRERGNRSIILVPEKRQRRGVLDFLEHLSKLELALKAVTSRPHWHKLVFGKEPDWCITVPTPFPGALQGLRSNGLTIVAIGDGADNEAFYETIQAAEAAVAGLGDSLFVQLW